MLTYPCKKARLKMKNYFMEIMREPKFAGVTIEMCSGEKYTFRMDSYKFQMSEDKTVIIFSDNNRTIAINSEYISAVITF